MKHKPVTSLGDPADLQAPCQTAAGVSQHRLDFRVCLSFSDSPEQHVGGRWPQTPRVLSHRSGGACFLTEPKHWAKATWKEEAGFEPLQTPQTSVGWSETLPPLPGRGGSPALTSSFTSSAEMFEI